MTLAEMCSLRTELDHAIDILQEQHDECAFGLQAWIAIAIDENRQRRDKLIKEIARIDRRALSDADVELVRAR